MVPNKSDLKKFISSWFPNYRKKFQIPISGSNISWGRGIDGNGQSGGFGVAELAVAKMLWSRKRTKGAALWMVKLTVP